MTHSISLVRRSAAVLGVAAVATSLSFVAPAVSGAATKTVTVKLSDFKVTPSVKSVKAGKVTFVVKNAAGMTHELVVIKTAKKAAALPMSGGSASEKGSVGETGDLDGGKTKKLTLTLKKGHYALICNVGAHYSLGMHADFTVS